ncbi:unnamed protein product [Dicrocoelium dendriticum]|nr:unnamed protein product [Dicrocoelium dendriticum]
MVLKLTHYLLSDFYKFQKGQLNDYMYQALMSDRHDFVKLFLEQGFSLEEFLTVYMLEKLYTDQLKNMQSSKVALRDVGKVIKALVGDFYHPLYLSKEFQAKLMPEKRPEVTDVMTQLIQRSRHTARRLAASAEADYEDNDLEKRGLTSRSSSQDQYLTRGIPRSYTTITTVSCDPASPSHRPITAAIGGQDRSPGHAPRERDHHHSSTKHENERTRHNAHHRKGRSTSHGRGYQNGIRHARRRPSLDNMQDIPIPGQPLVYTPIVTTIGYQSKNFQSAAYTSIGPGRFRMTGRAPLAYDASVEDYSVVVPLNQSIVDSFYAPSQDLDEGRPVQGDAAIQRQPNLSSLSMEFAGEAPFASGESSACWARLAEFCIRIFRRKRSKPQELPGTNMASKAGMGFKGQKEFATLRAMAALAAATAATAVTDTSKAPQNDLHGSQEPGSTVVVITILTN